ncbi:hypothetical protein L1049_021453 [Liquidambar formosana]|uniref:PORR domain-containing protein n=1 Tax=Liquidambar formosana TaxID=63359 RepID=A0AAP0N4N0_LIQFO
MTEEAEDLVQKEGRILEGHAETLQYFLYQRTRFAHFRRNLGLPLDFRTSWVHHNPWHFRVVKSEDDEEYLELVFWNLAWANTELENKILRHVYKIAYLQSFLESCASMDHRHIIMLEKLRERK